MTVIDIEVITMNYLRHLILISIAFISFYLIFSQSAYAYIDPGYGSYIFQLAMGILFGALFAIKLFWNKIKGFLKNLFFGKKKYARNNKR